MLYYVTNLVILVDERARNHFAQNLAEDCLVFGGECRGRRHSIGNFVRHNGNIQWIYVNTIVCSRLAAISNEKTLLTFAWNRQNRENYLNDSSDIY